MSAVVPHAKISETVVVGLFRDGLRAAVAADSILDPVAGSRPTRSEFVLTAFPESNVYYPHIVVQEGGDTGSRVDAGVDLHEHDFIVVLTLSARNKTHLFRLKDEVRGWVLGNHLTLAAGGFMDLRLLSSAPVVHERDSDVVEWRLSVGGTVMSSTKEE